MTCVIEGCDKPNKGGKSSPCSMHQNRIRRHGDPHFVKRIFNDDVARFWSYINKTDDGHWLWTGPKTRSSGSKKYYGYLEINGTNIKAHRYSYKLKYGKLDDNLVLDHVVERCTNTLCVNPDCLEPVPVGINTQRYYASKTHCINGHEYTPQNIYIRKDKGTRMCRQCSKDRKARN